MPTLILKNHASGLKKHVIWKKKKLGTLYLSFATLPKGVFKP